ncbi:MAG: TIR domain-containing protein [Pirellulaceae bacterium]|nr:TIR domain-containing protein [Pirellulaceae bacterium]
MSGSTASNYFVSSLLRAWDWQHRPQFDDVCQWWRGGGRGVLALVGMGGAGKTAIAERFLRVLPGGLPPDPDVPKDGSLPTPHGVFVFSFYDAPNPEAFFEALQMWLEHSPRIENVLSLGQIFYLLQQTSGLLVLDGLEKVQEDGVRGLLGRLASPKLREFLDRIAAGYFSELSVLITSRFPLADLRDARPQFFRLLPIEEIELPAGIRLLRARGVRGTDPQLAPIVDACGRHALTVDFAGGYIAEFGGGDPATPVDFEMDSARLRQRLDDEPDEARRHVLKQGHRFARLAERYRDAMLGGMDERSEGDAAALALLQRICLFRLGVDAETLANIFTGEQAVKVSGLALAGLSGPQLQKKLDWLVRMRIVECQSPIRNLQSAVSDHKSKTRYSIHPAVRDGFLSGIAADALRENHEAVRQGLEVSLGDAPGENPSDPATLDLLEEIVHHTLQSGHVPEAWDIYENQIGGYQNLLWRLDEYERGERICRAFAGGMSPESLFAPAPLAPRAGRGAGGEGRSPANATTFRVLPYQSLPEDDQAIFINEWAVYLHSLGQIAAATRCYELVVGMPFCKKSNKQASIGNQNLSEAWLLSGRLTAGQATAAGALLLAELADDEEERLNSHADRAYAHTLRGEVPVALADFRAALKWQHKAESHAPNRPLYGLRGIQHTHLLARLGRRVEATRLTTKNLEVWATEHQADGARSNLILSDLHREAGDLAEAETLLASAHDWAVARDAKEVLCWSALVQARIALAAVVGPEGAQQISPGQSDAALAAERRPGNAEHPTRQALKGRNKTPAAGLFRPFRAEDSARTPDSQGDALGWSVAGPSGRNAAAAATALADGLKIARDCGFGCYHIDLLLARARLHLVSGEPHAALDDLRTALDEGVPGDEQTGQPELLAATHPECGYAWAIAEGLQLRAEALLLQAAQTLGQPTFVPAHRSALPADVRDLLTQAESCLTESLARWQPLHDPEPERTDQNFQLDGKQYNYRAAQTHRLLTDLAGGVLTNYPLRPLSEPTPETPKPESEPTMTFHVFLSHNSKDKPAVKELGLELKQRGLNPWLDEWELRPGLGWQDALEDIINTCQSAAICVADNGIGPWEDPEMKALLRRFVNEKKTGNILPVIPVLLPGAPATIKLPLFLEEFTWVDLRNGLTKDGLDKLVWGITGKKPNP